MSEASIAALEAANHLNAANPNNPDNLSLESLTLLLNTSRLAFLEFKMVSELKELKERQRNVSKLHQLMKAFNSYSNEKGEVTFPKDGSLADLLRQGNELGVEIDLEKTSYTREERTQMVDNLKLTIEDLNVLNEMQLQTITRLTNERYESYQMARSILKPLHDDKINKARGIQGR